MARADGFEPDVKVRTQQFKVGCVAPAHGRLPSLAAYKEVGFPVAAIASPTRPAPRRSRERWGIPTVHDTPRTADRGPEGRDHRPRLSARPAAGSDPPCAEAAAHQGDPGAEAARAVARRSRRAARRGGKAAGKILSVNQNMRYDQSMRVLKQIIDRGALGDIVFAQIDMHAIPHWQTFLEDYDRLTLPT